MALCAMRRFTTP